MPIFKLPRFSTPLYTLVPPFWGLSIHFETTNGRKFFKRIFNLEHHLSGRVKKILMVEAVAGFPSPPVSYRFLSGTSGTGGTALLSQRFPASHCLFPKWDCGTTPQCLPWHPGSLPYCRFYMYPLRRPHIIIGIVLCMANRSTLSRSFR